MSTLGKMAAGSANALKIYVDDVFATFMYTGTGVSASINNGLDLAGKGGLAIIKSIGAGRSWSWNDTMRGGNNTLDSISGAMPTSPGTGVNGFTANGFTIAGGSAAVNNNGERFSSWSFVKAPKFFDEVQYIGNGLASRVVPHGLGVPPGAMIVKSITGAGSNWYVYHRSIGAAKFATLNSPNSFAADLGAWNNMEPAGTSFTVGINANVNQNGVAYVAYLFAHDVTPDSLIQCGSFTTNGNGDATVPLGWEPQWTLTKSSATNDNWMIADSFRGMTQNEVARLMPNLPNSEDTITSYLTVPTATGFFAKGFSANTTYIFVAIRRSNKPPENADQVYSAYSWQGNGAITPLIQIGFPVDLMLTGNRSGYSGMGQAFFSRLSGYRNMMQTFSISAEQDSGGSCFSAPWGSTSIDYGVDSGWSFTNALGVNFTTRCFKRAIGFLDVVCYAGVGNVSTIPHALGTVPELIISKRRSSNDSWGVYVAPLGGSKVLFLNSENAGVINSGYWNNAAPTENVFSVGNSQNMQSSSYVSYLFATKTGISKVGSYTGNGSNQTINCGFSSGARFILIKRSDAAGDWYLWDSARGIVAGNDPHLSLNNPLAEVTTDDSVDPAASGFVVNQVPATNINVSGGIYIFLAIA